MSSVLSRQQQAVVHLLTASGRYADEQQVLDEALELLRQRDDLRERLQVGIAQLDTGERVPLDEAISELRRSRKST